MTENQPQTETPKEQQQKAPSVEQSFKFQSIYLLPILTSLFFGLLCALLLAPHQSELVLPSAPAGEDTPGAPLYNAAYFVILLAISATVFYILLKRKSKKLISILITVAMTTAALLVSFVYLTAALYYVPYGEWLLFPLAIIITVIFDLSIFKFGGAARNIAVICIGGALGIYLGSSFLQYAGLLSVVVILVFLSIYDIIAVYRGPVGKIAENNGLDQLNGLSFSFKDIQMGLGDLVFYSVLTGAIYFQFSYSVLPVLASIVGIMIGSVITFYMLEKRGIFPGLPFPIILGLALGLVVGFLL
jgi:presenilin-like A22 family membrane protease